MRVDLPAPLGPSRAEVALLDAQRHALEGLHAIGIGLPEVDDLEGGLVAGCAAESGRLGIAVLFRASSPCRRSRPADVARPRRPAAGPSTFACLPESCRGRPLHPAPRRQPPARAERAPPRLRARRRRAFRLHPGPVPAGALPLRRRQADQAQLFWLPRSARAVRCSAWRSPCPMCRAATALLSGLREGDTIEASGPMVVSACSTPTRTRYPLVGTGTASPPTAPCCRSRCQLIAARGVEVFGVRRAHRGRAAVRRRIPCLRKPPRRASAISPAGARRARRAARARPPRPRAGGARRTRARSGARHRSPLRQPRDGRPCLTPAEGTRPARAAHPPREISRAERTHSAQGQRHGHAPPTAPAPHGVVLAEGGKAVVARAVAQGPLLAHEQRRGQRRGTEIRPVQAGTRAHQQHRQQEGGHEHAEDRPVGVAEQDGGGLGPGLDVLVAVLPMAYSVS